jgi:tetratricopeptide (TPR) repeat protein
MISMTEWYLGENWDRETQELFEERLKKSRGSYNKAQYLRIKAGCLLKAKDPQIRIEGSKLMERVINEFPNEISHVMFAHEQLGDYYFSEKKYSQAEFNYRQSVSFYKENGRSGTSGIGDIKLAETILKAQEFDKLTEMYHLLIDEFKRNQGQLLLNDNIFRYYSVLAKIANGLRKKSEAREYARKALQLASITKPQLDKYPRLGLVTISNEERNSLYAILGD